MTWPGLARPGDNCDLPRPHWLTVSPQSDIRRPNPTGSYLIGDESSGWDLLSLKSGYIYTEHIGAIVKTETRHEKLTDCSGDQWSGVVGI